MEYDLIVIGAGPGGYETAAEASSLYGMKTALIECRNLPEQRLYTYKDFYTYGRAF